MVVTYAWKIDSDLYAYIVNDKYLDNGGNLLDEYNNSASMSEFKGVLYEERLDETAEKKIYLYCQNNWSTHSQTELEWYTECFNSMLDKIHNYEYPSYFYISLLDAETYFNVDAECEEEEKECCVYTPDGDDVTDCNKQGNYTVTTKYDFGGIGKGTPLYLLTGLSFSEILNIALFGDQCGNIAPPEDTEGYLFVEPDTLTVDGTNRLFVEPSILTVPSSNSEYLYVSPSSLTIGKNGSISVVPSALTVYKSKS